MIRSSPDTISGTSLLCAKNTSKAEAELQASRIIIYFVVAASGSYGMSPVAAQDTQTSPDALVSAADASLHAGRYEDAREAYRVLLAQGIDRAAVGFARTFESTGAFSEGITAFDALLRRTAGAPALRCARGRLRVRLGQYEGAVQDFTAGLQQAADLWTCAADLADLWWRTGRRRDARSLYIAIYDRYKRGAFRTAAELAVAGSAAVALEQFRDANEAFRTANRVDPRDTFVLYSWAELFREKFNEADARRTFEDVLALNPQYAAAMSGLARATPSFEKQDELARRAISINPNLTDALDLLTSLQILEGGYSEAEALAVRALDVNPRSIPSLAQLASIHFLSGDVPAYQTIEQRALDIDPHASDFYLAVAENAVRRFRYPDAATIVAQAVGADPTDAQARAEMGMALLRLGRISEARTHLESAFERDPYNLFASNTLTLLDALDEFVQLESAHFRLLVHASESEVMGPLLLETAEACFDSLSGRYGYLPREKVLIEAYNDAGDFAVRVAGVPHSGLLGVSFGDVVAVNTPHAQSGSAYNWARTLWHEIAHTMAIGVARYRVPRWFTEGLSVYEEQRAQPAWGREMELTFLTAFDAGRLLPLTEIDRGFTRPTYPGQTIMSYYHAGQVIDFLVDAFGFDAVVRILEAFGSGASVEEAVHTGTGVGLSELDRRFRERVQRRRQQVAHALGGAAASEDAPTSAPRGPFFSRLQSAMSYLESGDLSAAETGFKAALAMYPEYVGENNAYEGLASIYRERGQTADLVGVLTRYLQLAEGEVDAALELSALHAQRGDLASAATMLERSLHVAPYDVEVRGLLADLYDRMQHFGEAAGHRRAVVALDPPDRAGAYYRLARTLHGGGQTGQARRAVLHSLEIAPDFRDAQKLLLEITE